MAASILLSFLALTGISSAYVPRVRNTTLSSAELSQLVKRGGDPSDFSWVKRWAAIGDSYTAGIGAGAPMGQLLWEPLSITLPNGMISGHGDWYCARYDMSYPKIINRMLGGQVEDFQYTACSGDRTGQIFQQAQQLKGDLDMVMMTAGGNDLCLAGIISDCIMLSSRSHEACEAVISKAEENAKNIIKGNVKDILYALNDKMKSKDSIVVVNGYAEFFDTTANNCEDQSWDIFWWLKPLRAPEKVTLDRRKRFNALVQTINNAIADAVQEIADDNSKIKYRIGFADWNQWVYNGVDGQMCSTKSNGDYPDPNQPDMQFIKPDTHPWFNWQSDVEHELRRRYESGELNADKEALIEKRREEYDQLWKRKEKKIWDSVLFNSPNPAGIVRRVLGKRDPQAPGCPGDDKWDVTRGLGLPNSIGANFHPNENGHVTIASFAMAEAMDLRSLVIGEDSPSCAVKDQFKCASADGSHAYAMAERLDRHYQSFCQPKIEHPEHTTGWTYSQTYDKGTPEEATFTIRLSSAVADYKYEECFESFKALIHSCDTNSGSSKNWKFGGTYIRGDYTYELKMNKKNRPWPPPTNAFGKCAGWYKFLYSEYTLYGAAFSTYDYGQETLLPKMADCYGLGTTKWKFNYYDEPTKEGYEWKATFRTPIWVRSRCFKNNKVVKGALGWTDGCGGND